jgi:TolA-binding protein
VNPSKLAIALFSAIPALAFASSFSKDYTESMIVQDTVSMAEAKRTLIDKIRFDAANDAGARLKKVTRLTQTDTTDPDPTSTFSKTMVSLIHVGLTKYSINTIKDGQMDGQMELTATASVTVDDTELQHADEEERKVRVQQERLASLEHENQNLKHENQNLKYENQILKYENRDLRTGTGLATQVASQPAPYLVQPPPVQPAPDQSDQDILSDPDLKNGLTIQPMQLHVTPYIDEVVQSAEKKKDQGLLSQDERNNNTLTPEQQVRFDQLCERFRSVDQMILNAGVQSSYLGTKDVKELPVGNGNSLILIKSGMRVAWDWTKEMELIRHLMGNAGTVEGNTYIVQGSEVDDKALLVAVRKCEGADHFFVSVKGDGSGELFSAFSHSISDPNGKTYRLTFKGDYVVNVSSDTGRDRGQLLNSDEQVTSARLIDAFKNFKSDKNRLFGTDSPADPIRFGNEEVKAEVARNSVQTEHYEFTTQNHVVYKPSFWDKLGFAWHRLSDGPITAPIVGGQQ